MPHGDWPAIYGRKRDWPAVNPNPAELRTAVFIPGKSIQDHHIAERGLSPTKAALIGAKVYRNTTQNVADVTDKDIPFNSTVWDEGGFVVSSSPFTTITVPFSGIYAVAVSIEWESNPTGTRIAWLVVNGTKREAVTTNGHGSGVNVRQTLSTLRRLTQGDTLGVTVRQNSGVSLAVQAGEDNCALAADYRGPI